MGRYGKLYAEHEPYVVYKKVNDQKYFHYNANVKKWVVSDNYWSPSDGTTFFETDEGITETCPSRMRMWNAVDGDTSIPTEVLIACDFFFGNRCPETHPFAYDDGANCCASPFEDFNDEHGRNCDGSPLSLESKCCLNAYEHESLKVSCPTDHPNSGTGAKCLNHITAAAKATEFSFLKNTNHFYKYSHRGCPDGLNDVSDCGENSQISRFKLCPNWLSWEPWSSCLKDEKVVKVVDGFETENFYHKFKRTKIRQCNTFDDQCLTEPGLLRSHYEEEICSKHPISYHKDVPSIYF